MKKFGILRMLFVAALVMAGGCVASRPDLADNIDDLRYDESLWDDSMLAILVEGTKVVDKDSVFEIVPPPVNSSVETRVELDYLETLSQTLRTPEILKMIYFENSGAPMGDIFVHGGYLAWANNKKLLPLLEVADHDMRYFTIKHKKQFLRPRPITLRPELTPAIATPPHPAYPSGHGGQSWLVGLLLSYVDSENADVYMKFAKSVGFRREIAGVHYPSDSAQGRRLAEQIFVKLLENGVFAKKLAKAKQAYVKPDFSKAYVVTEFDNPSGVQEKNSDLQDDSSDPNLR